MAEKESDLEILKNDYLKFQKKYNLPSFEELNKEFRIERIAEIQTDFLLREIRNQIEEFLDNFLRFNETISNPINAPSFFFDIINSMTKENKEKIDEIQKKLSNLIIERMELIDYSEEKEAEFIKKADKIWKEIKKDFIEIMRSLGKKSDKKNNENSGKAYFG